MRVAPTALAWPVATRMVFAGLPWRDPLDDVVDAVDRDLVEQEVAAFGQATDGSLEPWSQRRLNDPALPLRRAIAGRFAAAGDRVLYVAEDLPTAVAETRHHQERRARRGGDPPHPISMRVLRVANVRAAPHDLRGLRTELPAVYDPDDYAESVLLAHALRRTATPDGVVYESVRRAGGVNLALFRKRYASIAEAGRVEFDWDGTRIRGWNVIG